MGRRVTLQDLADELELSSSTVSRALRGHPHINEVTRQAVAAMAEKLGYTAHLSKPAPVVAGTEAEQRKPIVWVTPIDNFEYEDPIILESIGGMASRCAEIGRHLLVVPTDASHEMDTYREFIGSGAVGGFVVANARAEGDRRVEFLLENNIPFVLHGNPPLNRAYPYVDIAFADAHAHATRYLLDLGHRRIALINSIPGFRFSMERERGYRAAMRERGVRVSENLVVAGPKTEEFGYRMMRRLLDSRPAPTAVVCSSAMTAKGALVALDESRLQLGIDFSLIAYDDIAGTFYAQPLTTLFAPVRPLGRQIIRLLERAMAGEDYAGLNHVAVPELVIRSSTGPLAAAAPSAGAKPPARQGAASPPHD